MGEFCPRFVETARCVSPDRNDSHVQVAGRGAGTPLNLSALRMRSFGQSRSTAWFQTLARNKKPTKPAQAKMEAVEAAGHMLEPEINERLERIGEPLGHRRDEKQREQRVGDRRVAPN